MGIPLKGESLPFKPARFGSAGYRNGLNGKESGTFFAFSRLLNDLKKEGRQPPVVMLENVQGLLTSNNGQDIIAVIDNFCKLGYCVDIIEINAKYFTPQSRPRIFIFGIFPEIAESISIVKNHKRNYIEWEARIQSNKVLRPTKIIKVMIGNDEYNWCALNLPNIIETNKELSFVIEEIGDDSNLWWSKDRCEHLFAQISETNKVKLESMMDSNEYSYGTVYRRMRNGKSMAELRNDGIAGCLRTPKGGSSKQILVRAGKGAFSVRLLTPRECARLQGVSDTFKLPNNVNKALFGLGDAVCVPVIKWIVDNVFEQAYSVFSSIENNGEAVSFKIK